MATTATTRKKPAARVAPSLPPTSPHEDAVIRAALAILEARLKAATTAMASPEAASEYLKLQIGGHDREVFGVMFLNAQHRLIAFEVMFQGTLTQTSVYPREVARRALEHNAAGVILAHNHPSGELAASLQDIRITEALERCLMLFDVKVLDHLIVSGGRHYSFAQHGLIGGGKASERIKTWPH